MRSGREPGPVPNLPAVGNFFAPPAVSYAMLEGCRPPCWRAGRPGGAAGSKDGRHVRMRMRAVAVVVLLAGTGRGPWSGINVPPRHTRRVSSVIRWNMRRPNAWWGVAVATLFVTGCGKGSSSPAVGEKQESGQEVSHRPEEEGQTLDAFESLLTDGSWYRTTGSGPSTERYAFTFRADHSVGSRIYADFTNRAVVRSWRVSPCSPTGCLSLRTASAKVLCQTIRALSTCFRQEVGCGIVPVQIEWMCMPPRRPPRSSAMRRCRRRWQSSITPMAPCLMIRGSPTPTTERGGSPTRNTTCNVVATQPGKPPDLPVVPLLKSA
jgi:hypothetical protein